MSVVTQFEDVGPSRKKLTIEVPAPAVEAETGRVVKELGRTIHLPGFRKGKIPASLLRKRFADEIERRVAEVLVPRYWHQAEAEKSLETLTQPQIEDLTYEAGAAMTFVAVVETRPEIELKNIDDFTLPELEVEPSEEDVEGALTDMRRQFAKTARVERPSANGDVVLGNVVRVTGGEGDEEVETQPLRIELGAPGADEELSLALTGLAAGQSTIFKRAMGAGEDAETVEYRIDVSAVEEIELPELDDDFAAKIGAPDAKKLKEDMAAHLRDQKQKERASMREAALLEQLRERHPIDLPEGVVDQEVEQMLHEQASRLSSQGVDLEKAGIDWQAVGAQMRPEAQKRVHSSLLLEAIAKEKNLKLDEKEFEGVLASIARSQKKSSLAVRQELDQAGRLPQLRAQLLERRTVRHLLGEDPPAEEAALDAAALDAAALDAAASEETPQAAAANAAADEDE